MVKEPKLKPNKKQSVDQVGLPILIYRQTTLLHPPTQSKNTIAPVLASHRPLAVFHAHLCFMFHFPRSCLCFMCFMFHSGRHACVSVFRRVLVPRKLFWWSIFLSPRSARYAKARAIHCRQHRSRVQHCVSCFVFRVSSSVFHVSTPRPPMTRGIITYHSGYARDTS